MVVKHGGRKRNRLWKGAQAINIKIDESFPNFSTYIIQPFLLFYCVLR